MLSLLLHALIIVVFGSPAGGGGPMGWRNPLTVTLRARVPEAESVFRTSPGGERGHAGPAFPRAPERAPRTADRASAAAPASPPSGRPVSPALPAAETSLAPPAPAPAEDVLPRIDLGAPVEVDKAVVPQVKIVPLEERPEAAPLPAPAARKPKKPATPGAPAAVPPDLPVGSLPPQDLPASRSVETAPAQRVETPKATVLQGDAPPRPEAVAPSIEPTVVAAPEVAPPAVVAPTPVEPRPQPILSPLPEPEVIPLPEPAPTLRETPQVKTEREAPAPVVPPPSVTVPAPPVTVPAPPAAAPEPPVRIATPPLPEAPPIPASPSTEPAIPASASPRESAPSASAPAAAPGQSQDAARPREVPAASGPARLNFGAQPTVDDDLRQLVEPPSATLAAPGARPRLSFEGPARDANRAGGRWTGLVPLNLAPPAPEPETKLGRAIQKAAQPDCREAYAGLGLLAVPVLIADAITDKGCRW